jgi:hypothetical protein
MGAHASAGVSGLKTVSLINFCPLHYAAVRGRKLFYREAGNRNARSIALCIVVQNGNAYAEGIGAGFDAIKPFWKNRNPATEKPVGSLLTKETTVFQYTHGVKDPDVISPDSYTFDQFLLDRSGNDAIQLDLLYDYQSNLSRYDGWHEYFRAKQPRMLIVWGRNDPFFTVEGAKAYQRDLPNAEFHLLDTATSRWKTLATSSPSGYAVFSAKV